MFCAHSTQQDQYRASWYVEGEGRREQGARACRLLLADALEVLVQGDDGAAEDGGLAPAREEAAVQPSKALAPQQLPPNGEHGRRYPARRELHARLEHVERTRHRNLPAAAAALKRIAAKVHATAPRTVHSDARYTTFILSSHRPQRCPRRGQSQLG